MSSCKNSSATPLKSFCIFMARALNILLIDDDDNDILLFRLATNAINNKHKVSSVKGASQAIQFLEGNNEQALPFPHLLIVDLKMPGMNGFEFLAWLRDHPKLRSLPAVVLSGSGLQADIQEAYRLGARGYLTKPFDRQDLDKTLRSMYSFWSECEFLPTPLNRLTPTSP